MQALKRIEHPGIVPLYDAGEDAGTPYLVFEYVEGPTLAARLREGPLPRKTFSMGEAHEKRYYVEARRIRTHRTAQEQPRTST